ncbi:hypothetical protein D9611_001191 [Ephemerocybe angulata]|uniref:Uncharacterized protein n=1 Tax=Ephemerocybe angulata TaxID=980116 RepID=A0A8H5FLJ9_9AGAR|nr:hypothetical protein D9611_001191 [Tulosesus angulatus]
MKLQVAHDGLWEAVKEVLLTSEGATQEEKLAPYRQFLTPDILDRLENMSRGSSVVSLRLGDQLDDGVEGDSEEYSPGLVPFKRKKKEKRIQSRRDR